MLPTRKWINLALYGWSNYLYHIYIRGSLINIVGGGSQKCNVDDLGGVTYNYVCFEKLATEVPLGRRDSGKFKAGEYHPPPLLHPLNEPLIITPTDTVPSGSYGYT